jgi:hypothetical protein
MALNPLPIVIMPATGSQLSRDQVLNLVSSLSSEVEQSTRMSAKLTTWGAYRQANGDAAMGVGPTTGFAAEQRVWLVAVSGAIRPSFGHGTMFPWGLFIYDAKTGVPLGLQAGPSGDWPPFFNSIADLAAD